MDEDLSFDEMETSPSTSPMPRVVVWQYRWRILLEDNSGSANVEKQSKKWYNNRKDCTRIAKQVKMKLPYLVDDDSRYKTVILRKRRCFRTIEEVDEKSTRTAAERMLTLIYADFIKRAVEKRARETCPACEIDDPSQLHHECLMMPFSEHLNLHFTYVCENINDNYILSKWEVYLDESGLMKKIHPVYMLKYRCIEWLNIDFKTDEWKSEVKRVCAELGRFESGFVF